MPNLLKCLITLTLNAIDGCREAVLFFSKPGLCMRRTGKALCVYHGGRSLAIGLELGIRIESHSS